MKPLRDLEVLARQEEGQFFDRKSLWEGAPGAKRVRDRRAVRDEIAAHVAAFANAWNLYRAIQTVVEGPKARYLDFGLGDPVEGRRGLPARASIFPFRVD